MERNSLTLFVFHFLNDLPNWSDETNDKECRLNDFFLSGGIEQIQMHFCIAFSIFK